MLEYSLKRKGKNTVITYRWKADVKEFNMPIDLEAGIKTIRIYPVTFKTGKTKIKNVRPENVKILEEKFYVQLKN